MFADLIVYNGKIFSIDLNMMRQSGTAIAILSDKIIAVGSDNEILKYCTDNTLIISANGNTILPGLCDSHCHASFTASSIMACNLFNVFPGENDTRETVMSVFKERLRKYIGEHPEEKIIRGTGWSLTVFSGCGWELPNRHELDDVCRDKPVVLESFCQHNIWVNTKAVELAGITEKTKTPTSGNITREPDGYPAGLFQEMSAIAMIKDGIPDYDYSVEQYKETITYYQKNLANRYGVTLINDALFTENARTAYKELAKNNELTMRVRGVYSIDHEDYEEKFEEAVKRKGKDNINDLFQINTIKVFVEGEFYMCEPYESGVTAALELPPDYTSRPLWPLEDNKKIFEEAMKAGFQLHVHAMGDGSVKQTLEALEHAQSIYGNENRNVIAHLMAVKPEDIEKTGKLKLIAAIQPRWMVCDTDLEGFCVPYFSKERSYNFYPNKRLRKAGCIVAYGTDFPVTPPPDPFHEIQCGMTRTVFPDAPDYEQYKGLVLGPEHDKLQDAVTLEESIQSLTINGAYQSFLENVTGSIEVGKSAEFVVLNCDLETMPVDEIYKCKAEMTVFKGEIVYSVGDTSDNNN